MIAHININGLSLYYEDRSPQQPDSILFLHGFPLDHSMWRHQVEYFSDDVSLHCARPARPRRHDRHRRAVAARTSDDRADGGRRRHAAGLPGGAANRRVRPVDGRIHRLRPVAQALRISSAGSFSPIPRPPPTAPEARAGRYQLAEQVKAGGSTIAADVMLPRLLAPENLNIAFGIGGAPDDRVHTAGSDRQTRCMRWRRGRTRRACWPILARRA